MLRNKFYIFFLFSLLPTLLFSQKKSKINYVIQEIDDVQIDGNLGEWKSALYTQDTALWSFALAKDKNNLFAAVRIKNERLFREAIISGVFVNLSYDDKKKDGAQLIFPRLSLELLNKFLKDEYQEQTFTDEELLKSSKVYHVKGFSKVIDGLLSFDNQYGIKAVARMDEQGALVYESVIPLDLVKFKTDKVAIQLGINTEYSQINRVKKNSSQQNSRGMMIYGRTPVINSLKNPYSSETEVWFSGNINK